ncbi:hypothetical protein IJF86_03180 [Candidatus Saccharibacteria bacterium]|nr:hypothetical protein [Candidatus Saccharibacteria bacterium]
MSPKTHQLTAAKDSFDKLFFAPLEKLRLKYESLKPTKEFKFKTITSNDLINAESELGRTIFGPIPVGHQREFFRSSKNIWIWHESWEELGVEKEITIRYEVRKDGVYKKPKVGGYQKIEGSELENFRKALHAYLKIVKEKLY